VTTPAGYADIVTAAAVGLNQRPLPLAALAGPAARHAEVLSARDPAAALLDAAALLTAARRAGLGTAAVTLPPAAAPDSAPELTPAACAVLAWAVLVNDPALLEDLLTAAAAAGLRAATPTLPALLDVAVRDRSLRPAVCAVLGERGRWLAAQRTDWQRVAAAASVAVSGDPAVWQTGGRAERRSWLTALRDRDPAGARDLLAAGWRQETGDDREGLLRVLARRLSGADEPFLEATLDDRKAAVRQAAAELLAAIPGSAFNVRAIARGVTTLRVERHGLKHRLAVAVPESCYPAAVRDGIDPVPPSSRIGARAWLLTQFIAAVPLPEWTSRLGLDPASLAGLTVADGFRADVHAGWRQATIRQRDASWAAALLAAGGHGAQARPPAAWTAAAELASVLPLAARVARARTLLAEHTLTDEAAAEVADCPGPWPDSLAGAVLRLLSRASVLARREAPGAGFLLAGNARGGPVSRSPGPAQPPRWLDPLLRAAGRKMPAGPDRGYAAHLRALAQAESIDTAWTARLCRAADTLDHRHVFHQELQ
jgi:hypothetical protein